MAPTRATYRKLHKRPLGWKTNPKIHCNVPTTRNMKRVNKLIKNGSLQNHLAINTSYLANVPIHQNIRNNKTDGCRNQRPVTVEESDGWKLQDQLGNGTIDKIENGLAVAEHGLKHWGQDHVQA